MSTIIFALKITLAKHALFLAAIALLCKLVKAKFSIITHKPIACQSLLKIILVNTFTAMYLLAFVKQRIRSVKCVLALLTGFYGLCNCISVARFDECAKYSAPYHIIISGPVI